MINKTRIINKYKKLARINSYPKHERNLADVLYQELFNLGCKVKEDNTAPKITGSTGNLIADFPGNDFFSGLLLSAHMDRIDSGNNICVKVSGDIIRGCNGNAGGDDLVGIVSILEILYQLKYNIADHIGIKIIFTVAEEIGLLGSQNISASDLESVKFGLVYDGEGKPGTIIHKSPAFKSFNIKVKGKGKKEVYKVTTSVISRLKTGKIDPETEFKICTAEKSNFESDKNSLRMKIEINSFNIEKMDNYIEETKDIIEEIADEYGCTIDFNINNYYSGFNLEPQNDLILLLKRAAKNGKFNINFLESNGGSDANIFNQMNIPAVNLGTGLQEAHSSDEIVNIKDITGLVEYTLEIIKVMREKKYYV